MLNAAVRFADADRRADADADVEVELAFHWRDVMPPSAPPLLPPSSLVYESTLATHALPTTVAAALRARAGVASFDAGRRRGARARE